MKIFLRAYDGLIFSVGQLLVFEFQGQNMKATVKGVHNHSLGEKSSNTSGRLGILTDQTEINFLKDPTSAIKIKSSAKKSVVSLLALVTLN
jgi:vesicle-fusing ATPase